MQDVQIELARVIVLIMFGLPVILLISLMFYRIWYNKNYTDEKGWRKCHDCKKVDEPMYYTDTWLGIEYRCYECSFKKDK